MPWQLMLRASIEHLGKSRRKTETTYIARGSVYPAADTTTLRRWLRVYDSLLPLFLNAMLKAALYTFSTSTSAILEMQFRPTCRLCLRGCRAFEVGEI